MDKSNASHDANPIPALEQLLVIPFLLAYLLEMILQYGTLGLGQRRYLIVAACGWCQLSRIQIHHPNIIGQSEGKFINFYAIHTKFKLYLKFFL